MPETYDIGSESLPFRSIYLSGNTVYFTDSNSGESATLSVDISNGGISTTSTAEGVESIAEFIQMVNNLVNVQGDISATRLFVHNDVSLSSNLYVGGDLSWNPNNIPNDSIPSEAVIGGSTNNELNSGLLYNTDISATAFKQLGNTIHSADGSEILSAINGDGTIIASANKVYQYNSATEIWDQLGNTITTAGAHIAGQNSLQLSDDGTIFAVLSLSLIHI